MENSEKLNEDTVWSLMVNNFYWSPEMLKKYNVNISMASNFDGKEQDSIYLQIFEVVMTAVLAQLKPSFEWYVTQKNHDGGIDFIGRSEFLKSKTLHLEGTITIGGQCKKSSQKIALDTELSSYVTNMTKNLKPTYIIAALSASISDDDIYQAQKDFIYAHKLHCHIFNRKNIEIIIADNLDIAGAIIRAGLPSIDAFNVIEYFRNKKSKTSPPLVSVSLPGTPLSGEVFKINVSIQWVPTDNHELRLKWNPANHGSGNLILVSPYGADSPDGASISFQDTSTDNIFQREIELEFITYSSGILQAGSIELVSYSGKQRVSLCHKDLPSFKVVPNLHPPFYEEPYEELLKAMNTSFSKTLAGHTTVLGVTGAGGSGKSRLCREFCLEKKRRGSIIVSAKQATTLEAPRRILANLLIALTGTFNPNNLLVDDIMSFLESLDIVLAKRAKNTVQGLIETAGRGSDACQNDDSILLSVFVLLIVAKARIAPLIIHLHDLHWCTLETLEFFESLIWQLDQLSKEKTADSACVSISVIFLLEGRIHEHRLVEGNDWSTYMFESFIKRLECDQVNCPDFTIDQSKIFISRLFEAIYTSNRISTDHQLTLQQEIITRIHEIASGNPFHVLESIKLLIQKDVLAQNATNALLYLATPIDNRIILPKSVYDTIEARWRYCLKINKPLAILLWATGLVEDRLPMSLFKFLWSKLAPNVNQLEIESVQFVRLPQSDYEGSAVTFVHENYFHALKRIGIDSDARHLITKVYYDWFDSAGKLGPEMRYLQARIGLENPNPDLKKIKTLLRSSLKSTRKQKNYSLCARVLVTLLDETTWHANRKRSLTHKSFIKACNEELELMALLSNSGRRDLVLERIEYIMSLISKRLSNRSNLSETQLGELTKTRLVMILKKARILMNDHRPEQAVELALQILNEFKMYVYEQKLSTNDKWIEFEMEIRCFLGVTLDLLGEHDKAIYETKKAVIIAESRMDFKKSISTVSTYSNILLARDPLESELRLTKCLNNLNPKDSAVRVRLNLAMTKLLIAYRSITTHKGCVAATLNEAEKILMPALAESQKIGHHADAAAASLILGLIRVLSGGDGENHFAQAVSYAVMARQMETLWRAYINWANSLYKKGRIPVEQARSALKIMKQSLSSYPQPEVSPRFRLVCVPMANAIRYLIKADQLEAIELLNKIPSLKLIFSDLKNGTLKKDRGGYSSHLLLHLEDADYVLY